MASETWHCTLNKNDIDNIMQGLYSILVSKDVPVQLEASNYSSSISTYFLFFFGRLNVYPFPNVPQWTLFWLKVNKLYLTCKTPSPSNRTKRNRLSGEFWREGLYYFRSFWCTYLNLIFDTVSLKRWKRLFPGVLQYDWHPDLHLRCRLRS